MLPPILRNAPAMAVVLLSVALSWTAGANADDPPRDPAPAVPPEPLVFNYHLMHPGGESLPGDPNGTKRLSGNNSSS